MQKSNSLASQTPSVSFDDEQLILVDSQDQITGYASKIDAHRGRGVRHRAFSIFLFDPAGRVLLQQRSPGKTLWGGYWSNTCCSHPRKGESLEIASQRRLQEELGVTAPLRFLFQFEYHAQFNDQGAEHELCSVLIGRLDSAQQLVPHPAEIQSTQWLAPEQIDHWVSNDPDTLTPWLKSEWQTIRNDFWQQLTDDALV
jgi:isopentenyl-diphosphate delta-isomerase